MRKKKYGIRKFVLPAITFVIAIFIWELVDYIFKIREIILPAPHEIFNAAIVNFNSLIGNTYITALESVLGFLIGSILGILIAILFIHSKTSKDSLYPYMIALKVSPLYALAPLLVIWFGNGMASKIVMSSMVAFFPVLVGSIKGFTAMQKDRLDLFKSFPSSKWQTFVKLRFPSALPFIFPALKVATSLAVVGAVIAEFTGASKGIGHLIVNSSYYLDTSLMFASIMMISLFGVLFFYSVDFLEKKIIFWQESD